MRASEILITKLKKMEGCRLEAYKDSAGVWTIGYGHTQGVKAGDKITPAQAEDYLRQDLARFEAEANATKNITTQGRFDAIVDFCYNLGIGNFRSSTLRKYLMANRPTWEIQEQFLKWVNAGGKKLGGLVSRRIWEAARFAEMLIVALVMAAGVSSCSPKIIEHEIVKHDTTYVEKLRRDSIYMRDSIYVHEYTQGDTVYRERDRWHYAWRDRLVHDSIYIAQRDTLREIQEIRVPAEISGWQWFQIYAGRLAIAAGAALIIGLVIKHYIATRI